MLEPSHRSKPSLEIDGLIEEPYAVVTLPVIVRLPCRALCHDIRSHHRLGSEQPQHSKLREAAEEQPAIVVRLPEPVGRAAMMHVTVPRQGNPDVDVREMK
jgi:hypothetical protein